jgi:hypothetical protein
VRNFIPVLFLLCSLTASAQVRVSISTDLTFMRNFSAKQKFLVLGQTLQGNLHFSEKESAYVWIMYFTNAKFKNKFTATAKSSTTIPASYPYTVTGLWKLNQFSLGWKHYFKGGFDTEDFWRLYGLAGFGLAFSDVENTFSTPLDTSLYTTNAPQSGTGHFYRLTVDLGAGIEFPIGGSFSVYGDIRTWIPSSSDPSPYLTENKNVPFVFMMNLGLRILFGY